MFIQVVGADGVELEVREGTSCKALNVVCQGTGLQIVIPIWDAYDSESSLSTFKRHWVAHYG